MKAGILILLAACFLNDQSNEYESRPGRISVEGAKAFTAEQIIKVSGLQSKAVVRTEAVESVAEKIQNAYAKRGYLRAKVLLRQRTEPPQPGQKYGVVDLDISIDEGAVFVVRRVEFVGNETTRDKLVRRKTRFIEAEPFNPELVDETVSNFNKWGRFEKLTKENIEINIDEQEHFVDILVKLKEKLRR